MASSGGCKKKGCKARLMRGEPWCFFHHPDKAAEREKGSQEGGRARQAMRRDLPHSALAADAPDSSLETVDDVLAWVRRTINFVMRGQIDPKVANSVSQALGVALKAFEAKKGDADRDSVNGEIAEVRAAMKALTPDQLEQMVRSHLGEPPAADH